MSKKREAKPETASSAIAVLPPEPASASRVWILLAFIIIVAAALRFTSLETAPPGLYPDEAINGVQGWEAAQTGIFKIFYPENNGREGLFINIAGIFEKSLGPTAAALRMWPALAGTLTVLAVFVLSRALDYSPTISLLASFLLATSFWHVNFSRIAFAGIQTPLFLTWGLALLLLSWNQKEEKPAGIAIALALAGGLCFGLGFHTYSAFRIAPVIALALIFAKRQAPRFIPTTVAWIAAAAVATLPLALYFAQHPEDFSQRASQVSVLQSPDPVGTFIQGFFKTLVMFNISGDQNPRHNIVGAPELLLPIGLCFLIGLITSLTNLKKSTGAWLLPLWLIVMLLPELLSAEGIPHSLRAIGVLPAVMLLAALGFDWLATKLGPSTMKWALPILLLSGAVDTYRYFGVWTKDPLTAAAFSSSYVKAADYLNSLPANAPRYVIVEAAGALVPHANPDGTTVQLPMPAQTVIFKTLGHSPVFYTTPNNPSVSIPAGIEAIAIQ